MPCYVSAVANHKKLLTVVPTMGRPEMCRTMLESWTKTQTDSDLILVLDAQDTDHLEAYCELAAEFNIKFCVCNTRSISAAFNEACQRRPYYDFYHMSNDDVVYHTPGWDKELMAAAESTGVGVAYPDDMQFGAACATFPVISGDIVRAMGWLMCPDLEYLHGDIIWQDLAKALGILHYCAGVKVEHKHFLNGKREPSGRAAGYSEQFKMDKEIQLKWQAANMPAALDKVRPMVTRMVPDPQGPRPVKVMLAVPTMGLMPDPTQWLTSFLTVSESLKALGCHVGVCFPYRMPWDAANNLIFQNAIDADFDYILRMDDDVHGVPADAIKKLFEADKPVIGAVYPMRHFPYALTAFIKKDPADNLEKIFGERRFGFTMPPMQGVQKVDLVGFGLTLIKVAAIKHIPRPMFYDMKGCPDDSVFCQRCADNGVEVWAHMDVQLSHRHVTPYNNLYLNNAEARFALATKAKIADKYVEDVLKNMFGEDGQKDMGQLKAWGSE